MGGAVFNQGGLYIQTSTIVGNEAHGGAANDPSASAGGGGIGTSSTIGDTAHGVGDAGGGMGSGGMYFPSASTGGLGSFNIGGGGGGGFEGSTENGTTATSSDPGKGVGLASGLGGSGGDDSGTAGDGSGSGGHSDSKQNFIGGFGGNFGYGGSGFGADGGGGGVGGGGGPGKETGSGGGGGFGGGGGGAVTAADGGYGGDGGFGGGAGAGADGNGSPGFGGGNASSGHGGSGAGMGGAIFNMQGTVTIENSTFVANSAVGGAVDPAVTDPGKGIGGAVFNLTGTVKTTASTFAANSADHYASQIFNIMHFGANGGTRTAKTTLVDTIVANGSGGAPNDVATDKSVYINPAQAPDSVADVDASKFDLITTPVKTNLESPSAQTEGTPLSAAPLLGALRSNGGPAMTMAPAANSPAIDAGGSSGLARDQRGDPRRVDFAGRANATGGDGSDIGAVELQPACPRQATPAQPCRTLRVSVSGSGSVTGGGISCPGGCSATLPDNTHLTLAAVPARGAVFSGWGGACTGHGACKLTMSASRVVRATFLRTPLKITSLRQSASRWGGRHAAHGKAPVGTTFTFDLNRAAVVTITFTQHGRTRGKLTHTARRGHNKLRFSGRISKHHRLAPGQYTLTLTATAGGQRARSRSLHFTILS